MFIIQDRSVDTFANVDKARIECTCMRDYFVDQERHKSSNSDLDAARGCANLRDNERTSTIRMEVLLVITSAFCDNAAYEIVSISIFVCLPRDLKAQGTLRDRRTDYDKACVGESILREKQYRKVIKNNVEI